MVDSVNFNPVRRHTISRPEWPRPHVIVTYATKINGQRVVIRFDSDPDYYAESVWGVALQVDMSRRQKKSLRQHYSLHIENSTGKGTGRSGLDFLLWAVRKMDEFQQTHPGSALYLGGADDRRERAYAAVQRYGFRPNIVDDYGGYWRTADDFIVWQRIKQIKQSPIEWVIRCPYDKAKLISIFGEEYVNTQIPMQERLAKKVKNTITLSEYEFWQKWYTPRAYNTVAMHYDASIVAFTNLWWRTITTQPNEAERQKAFLSQGDYADFAWDFLWHVSRIRDVSQRNEVATTKESYLYFRFLAIRYSAEQGYTVQGSYMSLYGSPPEDLVGTIDLATCLVDDEAAKRTLAHIDWGKLNRVANAQKLKERAAK